MMVVISTSAVPVGLRGELTRWLLEISPGTFVGNISARVRDELWTMCTEQAGNGNVFMVHAAKTEQRLSFRSHGTRWRPVDLDGLTLMLRPETPTASSNYSQQNNLNQSSRKRGDDAPAGWSIASRRRRFRSPIERKASKLGQTDPPATDDSNLPTDPPF